MSGWLPTAEEERWLVLGARLRGLLPADALRERAGGWRGTGPFARIALFVLGMLAAGLLVALFGFGTVELALFAGLVAIGAAEFLKLSKRLHGGGFEEGLWVTGALMITLWIAYHLDNAGLGDSTVYWIAAIVALFVAGLRLLSPFLVTCAALAFIDWLATTATVRALDAQMGTGLAALLVAATIAAVALAAGERTYARPSHDRMLDWLVVGMPLAVYARHTALGWFADLFGQPRTMPGHWATAAVLLALAVPMFVLGLRRRRHAPLLGGLACLACLAFESRFTLGGPTEAWLIGGGIALLLAGWAIDRFLREPRAGVTSTRLSDREGPLDLLQTVGTGALVQSGRTDAPPPAEYGQGGKFGGGGASGSF